jgi:hypothetical protein
MRKVLLIVMLLASSACGTPNQWQKPGTDQAAVDDDLRKCRHDALQESLRLSADWLPFAFDAPPFWNYRDGQTRRLMSRANDNSQMQAERMLAIICMRDKGYVISGA